MGEHRSEQRPAHEVVDLSAHRQARPTRVRVRRYEFGSWTVIRIEGEMDVQVREPVDDLLDDHVSHLALELDGVTFVDAGGLGIVIDLERRAHRAGGSVQLVAPSVAVTRLLELAGLASQFPVIASMDEAVSTLMILDPGPDA